MSSKHHKRMEQGRTPGKQSTRTRMRVERVIARVIAKKREAPTPAPHRSHHALSDLGEADDANR